MINIMFVNMILSIALFVTSLAFPFLVVLLAGDRFNYKTIPSLLLKYSLFFNVGCLFLSGFLGHVLYGHEIAASLGWNWSPFQYELGFSELALGVLGFLSPLYKKEFWIATITASVIWLIGAAGVHLYYLWGTEILDTVRFVIGWNIFIAVWLLALYGYYRMARVTDTTN